MSGAGSHHRGGLFLLNLWAWARRQKWLSVIRGWTPLDWKKRAALLIALPARRSTRFRRSARWNRRNWRVPTHKQGETQVVGASSFVGGVNVHAFAKGQFGLGENARLHVRALMAANYPVAVREIELAVPHGQNDRSMDSHIGKGVPYPIDMVFANPDHFIEIMEVVRPLNGGGRYTVGCWFWELETFPEAWLASLEQVDEVMVASRFVEASIRAVTDKPVCRVPVPLDEVVDSGLQRSDFGLEDDAFVFLCTFDFNSSLARKNPLAAVEAFRLAFSHGSEQVRLMLKSSNGHRYPDRFRELLAAVAGDRRILVRDEVIDREHLHALQRCCDAYVSLHRAEGFGLGLAECMRMGKPVIGTGYSGNLEFMTEQNSFLVDYTLIPVPADSYIHAEGQRWAAPDIRHAAALMRKVAAEPVLAAEVGRRAAIDIRERFSSQACANILVARLEEIASHRKMILPSSPDAIR